MIYDVICLEKVLTWKEVGRSTNAGVSSKTIVIFLAPPPVLVTNALCPEFWDVRDVDRNILNIVGERRQVMLTRQAYSVARRA